MHFRDSEFALLENKTKLITMHSAKGLEFPVVFLVDVAKDKIPLVFMVKHQEELPEQIEQEQKLFYVAMTRASERLYVLYPRDRPSPFLEYLAPATVTSIER